MPFLFGRQTYLSEATMMDYAGKIEKAKRYAEERSRVSISQFRATFRGEHDTYSLEFAGDRWHCTCRYFGSYGLCSHTMAMDRLLDGMLPAAALQSLG